MTRGRRLAGVWVLAGLLPSTVSHGEQTVPRGASIIDPAILEEGAHRAHALDTPKHRAYACERCHARGGVAVTLDGWVAATKSCESSYCHATPQRAAALTPIWQMSTMGRLGCNACHGFPPTTGAHRTHAAGDRYAIGCVVCHGGADWIEHHTGGEVHVALTARAGSEASYAASTCAGVACHANGQGAAHSVRWTEPALSCHSCHDDETSTAPRMSGQHERHFRVGVACADCHEGVVDRDKRIIDYTLHANGSVNVKVLAGRYAAGLCSPACHEPRLW